MVNLLLTVPYFDKPTKPTDEFMHTECRIISFGLSTRKGKEVINCQHHLADHLIHIIFNTEAMDMHENPQH